MESERQAVTVNIGGRKFTFHVEPSNVDRVKNGAAEIGAAISSYQGKFPERDIQDILSLVLMEFVMSQKGNK